MTTADPSLPTTKEELERKVLDFIVDLGHAHEQGELEPLVAVSQCKAAWTITAGLIDNELSAQLAQYADLIGPQPVRVILVGHGRVLMLAYQPRGTGYALLDVNTVSKDKTVIKRSEPGPGARAGEIEQLLANLIKAGYARIN